MIDLPYFEDIVVTYITYIYHTLFPNMKNSHHKVIVYIISFFHLIGTIMISFGIFFPPEYMGIYLIYLSLILLSYLLFNGHCFMTLFSNKHSGLIKYPLHIRMETAKKALLLNIFISLLGFIYPNYSLYKILSRIFV